MNEAVQGQAKSITHQKSYHHQIQYIYLYAVPHHRQIPGLDIFHVDTLISYYYELRYVFPYIFVL